MKRTILCAWTAFLPVVAASSGIACSSSTNGTPDQSVPPDGGVPYLTELSVTGGPSITLTPSFSSNIYDYYVTCAAGANPLTVAMTASKGATSSLTAPMKSASAASQTNSFSVNEGDAIVAVASAKGASTEYWVRCLPHDFATMTFVKHPEAGTAPPGYYLIGTKYDAQYASYAEVLDSNGVPVWYFADNIPVRNDLQGVDSLIPGTISFYPALAQPFTILHLSPAGPATYAGVPSLSLDVHELRVLPNGHVLVVNVPVTPGVDLTGLTLPLPNGTSEPLGPNSNIQNCQIMELDATGTPVWQWLATDHLDCVKDTIRNQPGENQPVSPNGGPIYDPIHCNSIDVDPANGNLLISARQLNSLFYIEKSTGKILWKMGGSSYTKDGAQYIPVPDAFYEQHDARLQPGWSEDCGGGQISVFDDETNEPNAMRGVVYNVHLGASDGDAGCKSAKGDAGAAWTADVAWQYQGPSNSSSMGSFRILPDGSRVIGWGAPTSTLAMTEVDIHGNDLLDLSLAQGIVTYRALKVPLSAFDLNVLRQSVGK
jgi:hypothetical protein